MFGDLADLELKGLSAAVALATSDEAVVVETKAAMASATSLRGVEHAFQHGWDLLHGQFRSSKGVLNGPAHNTLVEVLEKARAAAHEARSGKR